MSMRKLLLALVALFIIWIIIRQYLFCPQFSFEVPHPFSGASFYNPYDSINDQDWQKCNFHAHSNAWHGLSNGKGNSADIYRAYDSMKYAVHCVSDYQKINTDFKNSPGYISAYEHGYNITKTHQLVLGSNRVLWLDYFLPQTLDNKQNILNRLSADSDDAVIINHPGDHYSYSARDFKFLTNYTGVEVLSRFALSFSHWDSALSNGHPAFVLGNDDVHDIFLKETLGRMCTWVNVRQVNKNAVLSALKRGRSYGMIMGKPNVVLPHLKRFDITGDTISILMSEPAKEITFSGQNGKVLAVLKNTSSSKYIIKTEDHYVRTTIEYEGPIKICLNPVFRYNGTAVVRKPPSVNLQKTFIFRIIGALILIASSLMAIVFSLSQVTRERIRRGSGRIRMRK